MEAFSSRPKFVAPTLALKALNKITLLEELRSFMLNKDEAIAALEIQPKLYEEPSQEEEQEIREAVTPSPSGKVCSIERFLSR